jgi:hypothetical protein
MNLNLDVHGNWFFFIDLKCNGFGVLVSLNESSNSNRIASTQLTIVLKIRNVLGR